MRANSITTDESNEKAMLAFSQELDHKVWHLLKDGYRKKVISLYTEAINKYPDRPDYLRSWHYQRGVLLEGQAAIDDFTRVIELEGSSATYLRAQEYTKLGQLEEAIQDFSKTISMWEEKKSLPLEIIVNCFRERGKIYYQQGKYNEALTDLNKAFSIYSHFSGHDFSKSLIAIDRGLVYLKLNQAALAITEFTQSIATQESNIKEYEKPTNTTVTICTMEEGVQRIETNEERLTKKRCALGDTYLYLGQAYYQQANFARALESYKKAMQLHPGSEEIRRIHDELAYIMEGKIDFQHTRSFEAIADFLTMLGTHPDLAALELPPTIIRVLSLIGEQKLSESGIFSRLSLLMQHNIQDYFFNAALEERWEDVEIMLENNPTLISKVDPLSGKTILHLAAQKGNVALVVELIDKGVDKNAQIMFAGKDNGKNALYLAAERGHYNVVGILAIAGATLHLPLGERKEQAIHLAAKKGDLLTLQALLEHDITLLEQSDELGQTPLVLAVIAGAIDVVDYLISKRANVNVSLPSGLTCLDLAHQQKNRSLSGLLSKAGALTKKEKDEQIESQREKIFRTMNLAENAGELELFLQEGRKALVLYARSCEKKFSAYAEKLTLIIDEGLGEWDHSPYRPTAVIHKILLNEARLRELAKLASTPELLVEEAKVKRDLSQVKAIYNRYLEDKTVLELLKAVDECLQIPQQEVESLLITMKTELTQYKEEDHEGRARRKADRDVANANIECLASMRSWKQLRLPEVPTHIPMRTKVEAAGGALFNAPEPPAAEKNRKRKQSRKMLAM